MSDTRWRDPSVMLPALLALAVVLHVQRMAVPGLLWVLAPLLAFLPVYFLFIAADMRRPRDKGTKRLWLIALANLSLPFLAYLIRPEQSIIVYRQLFHALLILVLGIMLAFAGTKREFSSAFMVRLRSLFLWTSLFAGIAGLVKLVLRLYGIEVMELWYAEEHILGTSIVSDYNFYALSVIIGLMAMLTGRNRGTMPVILLTSVFWASLFLSGSRRGLILGMAIIAVLLVITAFKWIRKRRDKLRMVLLTAVTGLVIIFSGHLLGRYDSPARQALFRIPLVSAEALKEDMTLLSYRYAELFGITDDPKAHYAQLWTGGDTTGVAVQIDTLLAGHVIAIPQEEEAEHHTAGMDSRIRRWRAALDLYEEYTPAKKIFGAGFGYLGYFGRLGGGLVEFGYPHNILLSVLLANGLAGLAILILFLLTSFLWLLRMRGELFLMLVWGLTAAFTLISGDGFFSIPVASAIAYLPVFLARSEQEVNKSRIHVCHLTIVHSADDIRIFHKQCRGLAREGYRVTLLAGRGKEQDGDVRVRIIPVPVRRILRMTAGVCRFTRHALREQADIYHFHDPELIPAGLVLRLAGRKVIIDVHENVPAAFLSKPYLSPPLRHLMSWLGRLAEHIFYPMFTAVVTATPVISARFRRLRPVTVRNFPIIPDLDQIAPAEVPGDLPGVIYVGGLSEIRGTRELIRAFEGLEIARLWLLGPFETEEFRRECESLPGWENTVYLGVVSPQEVYTYLKAAKAGVSTILPYPNYLTSLATKSFEYMAAGLPVVMSDFPYWRETFGEDAIYTDPADPQAIRRSITQLFAEPGRAQAIGERNRELAHTVFRWSNEERVLMDLYKRLHDT